MKAILFFTLVALLNNKGIEAQNEDWFLGCYESTSQNSTKYSTFGRWNGPGHCTDLCAKARSKYAAVQSDKICLCLKDLQHQRKVNLTLCFNRCASSSHVRCGGKGRIVSIFNTSIPVVFNHSLTSPEFAGLQNASRFVAYASLAQANTADNIKINFTIPDYVLHNFVQVYWSVDETVVKEVRKTADEEDFSDTFNFTFTSFGVHSVCCNISNRFNWIAKCASVLAMEKIDTLEVVNVHGGKHTNEGNYAVVEKNSIHIDVVVNADSFAHLHFDFGDNSNVSEVKIGYRHALKNCSCLALTRKTHWYTEKGSYSLNITALNFWGRKELIFKNKLTVDGKIMDCKITTRFVAAGKRSRVYVEIDGAFKHVHFHWALADNRSEKTSVPYIDVDFPNTVSRYPIKVSAFNNVSEANANAVLYIEPEINNVTLQVESSVVTVNQNVIFASTVIKDHVVFSSSIQYTWHLGNGQRFPGTIPSFYHKYKKSGRYQARVQAGNFLNKRFSNYVTVNVYEVITQVEIKHKPFLLGDTTEITAVVTDGTDMTYSWSFGDNTTLVTSNRTVYHQYASHGSYVVKVKASNPISVKEDSTVIFALSYDCQKPEVSFPRLPFEENIKRKFGIEIDVDVSVNCSVSNRARYKWRIYSLEQKDKKEIDYLERGIMPSTLAERSLVLPPHTFKYGKYLVQLTVQMEGTVVFTRISKVVNILPSSIQAIILGGKVVSVGRKSHQNITLDASSSYDPDDKDFKALNFSWECRSIHGNRYESCFKPNASMQFNRTLPVFQFLPKMFIKSASLFAFIVTVSRNKQQSSTAIQFVKVEEGALQRLQVKCLDCSNPDADAHKNIKFEGICSDCDNTPVHYQWNVFSVPKVKIFLRYFGKCIPSNGSAWNEIDNLNNTNASTTNLPSTISSTTMPLTTTVAPVTPKEKVSEMEFQRLICEAELMKIRKNGTSLNINSRKRREILESSDLDDIVQMSSEKESSRRSKPAIEEWDDYALDDDDDSAWSHDISSVRDEMTDKESNFALKGRLRRDINPNNSSANNTNLGDSDSLSRADHSNPSGSSSLFSSAVGDSKPFFPSSSGSGGGQSNDDIANAGGSLFQQSSGSGRGSIGSGSGSGRPAPNSKGSGRGCEESLGLSGGRGLGSGTGNGAGSGCSENGGFGEGAKAHANKTSGSNTTGITDKSGGSSETWIASNLERELKTQLSMIREIMHPVELSSNDHYVVNSETFTIKKDSLVPGQLYMVEYVAQWQNSMQKRIAGRAKSYFFTNTGPFLGSCNVSPLIGMESQTVFSLKCNHWKDQHFPLRFSVQYKTDTSSKPTWIYYGLNTMSQFTLPAGSRSNANKIDLEVFVEDSEGVRTKLCPIKIQVLPLDDYFGSVEEYMYNRSIGNHTQLKKYEDVLDDGAAIIFIASTTNTLNRLLPQSVGSPKHHLRQVIRRRLLESVQKLPIQSEALANQVSRITRQLTLKPSEISLTSVELSNAVSSRIMMSYARFAKSLSMDVAEDLFVVVSNILSSASLKKLQGSARSYLGKLVKETLRIHKEIIQIVGKAKSVSKQPTVLKSDFLTSVLRSHGSRVNGTLSNNGCSFTLPQIMLNRTEGSNAIFSSLSVYEQSPYVMGAALSTIETKVASLEFRNSSGASIKISNLTQPIVIRLPARRQVNIKTTEYSVSIAKMNIHEFNLTKRRDSTIFVTLDEANDHHAMQVVIRYDDRPTERIYNQSFQLNKNTATVHFSSTLGLSKVFIGVFFKKVGRTPRKRMEMPVIKYKLRVYAVRCNFWNEKEDKWSPKGCEVAAKSTITDVICKCNHLTAFGGHIDTMIGAVEVKPLISFQRDDDHYLLLVVTLSIISIYLLLIAMYGMKARSDNLHESIASLPDNHPADSFRYLVIVETGSSHDAGTTARVSIVVYGKEGHSQIRELTCDDAYQFKRGSTGCVIMSFPDSLGDIKKIQLWHDNGGYSPNWFLKQITIVDCQTEQTWYFHWNNWLAITEESKADCEIPASTEPLVYSLQTIFEGILDYHIWISAFTGPSRSSFSKSQRLTVGLVTIVGYMFAIAVILKGNFAQRLEVHGIWDLKWQSILTSLIAAAAVFPLQLFLEALFRNIVENRDKAEESEICKEDEIAKEDELKSTGAVFFMEVNSAIYSSQNVLCTRDAGSLSGSKMSNPEAKQEMQLFGLPRWCQELGMLVSVVLSATGIAVTLWHNSSFGYSMTRLWAQSLLLSLTYSIFILEIIKAITLAIRRLYTLQRETIIKDYVNVLAVYDNGSWNRSKVRNKLCEKQIMVARARSRFVRFSKPILNDDLMKARKKAVRWHDLSTFVWELFTICVYFITLLILLRNSNSKEQYLRQAAIKELLTRPITNASFENISTPSHFWDWAEENLIEVLKWDCWHHLPGFSADAVLQDPSKLQYPNTLYTFGPACLEKNDNAELSGTSNALNRSSSANVTTFGKRILLVGKRHTLVATLRALRSSKWITSNTTKVRIAFSYFHPETSLFSYVQIHVHFSPVGRLNPRVEVDSVSLYSRWDAAQKLMTMFMIVSLLLIIISLRHEFSCLMDNGTSYFQKKWNFIEGMLIISVFLAACFNVWLFIESKKAAYQIETIHLNDPDIFLNLSGVMRLGQTLQVFYTTILFLLLLKSIKLLRIWTTFSVLLSVLKAASSKIFSLMVIFGLAIVTFFHVGTLILGPSSFIFSKTDSTIMALWSIVAKDQSIFLRDTLTSSSLMRIYKIFAVVAIYALWRLSAVFYIGQFKAAKEVRRRKIRLQKTLKIVFQKLRSKKTWLQLLDELWKRMFKRHEDKYKICNLPLENVYEEIEYQVEEVIFRLSNLFDMSDLPEKLGRATETDDDYTLDSSEDAAYPSSYSTKDSISLTSDSIYSEDSGYYRYGEYRGRYPSSSNSEDEYEGPVIHNLDPPRQRLRSLGQKVSPIFGGRYFVKTSWSTFRTPKIQPIEMKPPPKIELPQSSSRKTFEKVSNWSTKFPVESQSQGLEADARDYITTPEIFDAIQKSTHVRSAKMESLPRILPPQPKYNSTFEKVRNWSTKFPVERNCKALESDVSSSKNSLDTYETFSETSVDFDHDGQSRTDHESPNLLYQKRLLPKALQSMAPKIKFIPKFDESTTPFQRPPKIPPISEIMAHRRKHISFKKTQICPIDLDSPRSLSLSSDNTSMFQDFPSQSHKTNQRANKTRSPSFDSGIIQSSENEDSEVCDEILAV